MAQQVFVISDLHLGGEPGFEMCSPRGQHLLAAFIRSVTGRHGAGRDAHLVLAGDIVDFLAEKPGAAFTVDEAEAAGKLARIFERTRPVWDALRAHAAAGAPLTVLLGNHDVELTLPRPRRALLEVLGPGRVELLYDGEALRLGELLIEHGNRYDDWNWIDHDALLHLRRELSRGARPGELSFRPVPGSRFVVEVMNAIKQQFSFVDLLKPEDATVAPFVALLRPDLWDNIRTIGGTLGQYLSMKLRADALSPTGARGAGQDEGAPPAETARMLALAEEVAAGPDAWLASREVEAARGGVGAALSLLLSSRDKDRRAYLTKLLEVLRARHGDDAQAFNVQMELPAYTDAARAAGERGFKVVVYGHTHLVKHVTEGLAGATYLNSGTWADLMRVPTAILREATAQESALRELEAFADDIQDNQRAQRWRRQVPTFARVDLDDGLSARDAGVYLFREGAPLDQGRIPPDTEDIFTLTG
ncbi:metallophosphoesterase [Sorangium sp. So ce861]|uniref:metallophosphoesterase n=1 Tax=Sorangium sp. So ce861 TaxID=3133323 RepID=UPI003F613DC1